MPQAAAAGRAGDRAADRLALRSRTLHVALQLAPLLLKSASLGEGPLGLRGPGVGRGRHG